MIIGSKTEGCLVTAVLRDVTRNVLPWMAFCVLFNLFCNWLWLCCVSARRFTKKSLEQISISQI